MPQPPSPGSMDWSTGYWMDVPPLRKYASVAVWVPVGAFTPRPSAMFPEWLWGSSNHMLPIRLTSPNPSAVTAWRAESAYIRDCMPSTNGTVRQAEAIGHGVGRGDIDRVEVDDERLVGREELRPHEQLVGVEMPVPERDPPLVGCEIGHLQFALSPQTGGCEAHRHSALSERLPRKREEAEPNCEDCHWVNAHRTSSWNHLQSASAPQGSRRALAEIGRASCRERV